MTTSGTESLEALLDEAETAHGVFETTELNGVYDEEWPRWYAQYLIDHGIGALLGRAVSVDEVAQFLATSWDDRQAAGTTDEPWAPYTARRLATEL